MSIALTCSIGLHAKAQEMNSRRERIFQNLPLCAGSDTQLLVDCVWACYGLDVQQYVYFKEEICKEMKNKISEVVQSPIKKFMC